MGSRRPRTAPSSSAPRTVSARSASARRRRARRRWRSTPSGTTPSPSRSTCSSSGSSAGALSPDEADRRVKQVRGHDRRRPGRRRPRRPRRPARRADLHDRERSASSGRPSGPQRSRRPRAEKERIAGEAEKLSESNDWRNGADRMRDLLDEWKALPRLEKSADDALWRRFSTARTTYTRRRKAHFAELNEKREGARVDQGEARRGGRGAVRLDRVGPDVGHVPRPDAAVEGGRSGAARASTTSCGSGSAARRTCSSARATRPTPSSTREFAANAEKKEALLVEAEALLPVTDLRAAKAAFRDIAERWDAAGKVPRDRMKDLEGRMRKVEQAIRGVEDDAVAALQPRGPRPRRRHRRPARGLDRRPRGQARQGRRGRQRQEGRRARRRHRGPPVLAHRGAEGARRVLRLRLPSAVPHAVSSGPTPSGVGPLGVFWRGRVAEAGGGVRRHVRPATAPGASRASGGGSAARAVGHAGWRHGGRAGTASVSADAAGLAGLMATGGEYGATCGRSRAGLARH